jgi:lipid A disaccharide synthetase
MFGFKESISLADTFSGLLDAYSRLGQSRPPTVHYVAPSFWAWKGGEDRLNSLSKIVDHMLCILPFEEGVCQANGLAATFVGHPVLEDAHSAAAVCLCWYLISHSLFRHFL